MPAAQALPTEHAALPARSCTTTAATFATSTESTTTQPTTSGAATS